MKKQKIMRWFYPGIAIFIFSTYLIALLQDYIPNTVEVFLSTTMGMVSYSVMLTLVLIAIRPRQIEKHLELKAMYEVHAWMAIALIVTLFIHVFIRWSGLENIFTLEISDTSMLGYGGLISLFLVMITGIFVLSDVIIQKSDKLMEWKENKWNRNVHLWIHRLAIVSILFIYFHIWNVTYLSGNILLHTLNTIYTVFVLGSYFYYKIRIWRLPRYEVIANEMPTPDVHALQLKATKSDVMNYQPGQFGFFRFIDSDLPNEAHPFSFSSALDHESDIIEIMVKESGDWTSSLDIVKEGDQVTIEGPYGNFYPKEKENSDTPMILLSGGIGFTPSLSVLRHEMANNSDRRIAFLWGLHGEEDMIYTEELKRMADENKNFTFHLIFSGEEIEGYPHGHVDDTFIREEGLEEFYKTASWHVCGPPPMLEASKSLLAEQKVSKDQQYIEEFAF
ncbi:MAG: FAD-binding oxidoreductase [Atopococcus tabaci]|uniref:FAD-binding oxidoreductase n=1 Tax=Atopococcus tabaci TaxID=269774 RepID=A0AA43UBW1_9LACT|nr:FAD-binding oxidoreductase [Atopococcus tabaci]